jgi:hypothetical protein
MPSNILFNVGGTPYKVSHSLLESHPDSMLAKCICKKWRADPTVESFIDRNGTRFQYVLDYMRDGEVILPITETKEAVLAELAYFGIEADAKKVNDSGARHVGCVDSYNNALNDLQNKIARDEIEYRSKKLALDIIIRFTGEVVTSRSCTSEPIQISFRNKVVSSDSRDNLSDLFQMNKVEQISKAVNRQLNPLGLRFVNFSDADKVSVQKFNPFEERRMADSEQREASIDGDAEEMDHHE